MDINGRYDHIQDVLIKLHTGQWFGWSDSKNKVYANLIIHDDSKTKPTEKELLDAANDPNHPNSMKNMGKEAYYAWKSGGKVKEELTHGAGGTLVDKEGVVDKEASEENIAHLKT